MYTLTEKVKAELAACAPVKREVLVGIVATSFDKVADYGEFTGLCEYLHRELKLPPGPNIKEAVHSNWPEFSGCWVYPIPVTDDIYEHEYWDDTDEAEPDFQFENFPKWEGEPRELRRKLWAWWQLCAAHLLT